MNPLYFYFPQTIIAVEREIKTFAPDIFKRKVETFQSDTRFFKTTIIVIQLPYLRSII